MFFLPPRLWWADVYHLITWSSPCEVCRACSVLRMVMSAQRSKVRPIQSQLRSIPDRDDVIDLFGSATAADDAAHRVEPNEPGSELVPVCIVAAVCPIGPPSVEHGLAFTLVGRRAGPAVGRGFQGHG
jgi:hypothetical protein